MVRSIHAIDQTNHYTSFCWNKMKAQSKVNKWICKMIIYIYISGNNLIEKELQRRNRAVLCFFYRYQKDCATFSTLNLKIPNPTFSSSSSFSRILLHPENNSQSMSNYLNIVIHTSNSILNSMNEWRIKIFLNHYDVIRVPKTLFYCVIKSQLICIFSYR